ncbi:tyrosine-type recombinase/integrase [Zavarzinia sp. CC-PAN008]|uniref:tyrosine-type recombinase/integrase n=1 Tax=Zavarzinia sp. CC-PAN008 TaxID=3243332 RepID=UPI003F748E9E
MAVELKDALIRNLPPAEKGNRTEVWDALIRGLGVRVTDSGRKSFVLMRRVDGKLTRVTLGQYPAMSLKAARDAASAAVQQMAGGVNPTAEKRARKAAAAALERSTVAHVVADFDELYLQKATRSAAETRRTLDRFAVEAWGDRQLSSITIGDVHALLDKIAAGKFEDAEGEMRGGPVMANRALAALGKLFSWSVNRGKLAASPIPRGMEKPGGKEAPRERVLTADEIEAVWKAATADGYPFGPAVKIMLLTGQRRDEVGEMTWGELDLDKALWHLPAARTKNGLAHVVHLSAEALALLQAIRDGAEKRARDEMKRRLPAAQDEAAKAVAAALAGRFVFSTTAGERPISGWSKALAKLRNASGVDGWTYHDLRRTMTTHLADLSVAPHVADKILNHKGGAASRGVAGIYNRAEYLSERKAALDAWCTRVLMIAAGEEGRGNVVPFARPA